MDNAEIELVTVLHTSDRAALAVAKSFLEGAGIEYYAKNDMLVNRSTLPILMTGIELQVSSRDAEDAQLLLKDLIVEDRSEGVPPLTIHDLGIFVLIVIGTIGLLLFLRGGR